MLENTTIVWLRQIILTCSHGMHTVNIKQYVNPISNQPISFITPKSSFYFHFLTGFPAKSAVLSRLFPEALYRTLCNKYSYCDS